VHFKAECIESRMTKPQSKLAKPRVRHRLKTGSVPTELLELPNVRQKRHWFHRPCITDEPAEKSFWYVLLILNLIRITRNIMRMKLTKFCSEKYKIYLIIYFCDELDVPMIRFVWHLQFRYTVVY